MVDNVIKEFDNYVNNYDINDLDIKHKWEHSHRVKNNVVDLVETLNLSEEDKKIAIIIGILHDVGRFEQHKRYNTFQDHLSVDHAKLGADILFKEGLIKNFDIKEEHYQTIEIAIRNHNKLKLPNNLTEKDLLQSKIIRDADKLDILYDLIELDTLKIEQHGTDISDKVLEDFKNHKSINKVDTNTMTDKLIMILAFIYDINYNYTLNKMKELKLLEKLINKMPEEHRLEIEQIVNDYINERNE